MAEKEKNGKSDYFSRGKTQSLSAGKSGKNKSNQDVSYVKKMVSSQFVSFTIESTQGQPKLTLYTQKPFRSQADRFLESIDELEFQERQIYEGIDAILNYLKAKKLCDNQSNLPAEAVAEFYDPARQYVKYAHQDLSPSHVLEKSEQDFLPCIFSEYKISNDKVVIYLDNASFSHEFKQALINQLSTELQLPAKDKSATPRQSR